MLGQRTLSIDIREFEERDYERLVEVYNAIFPEYVRSVGEWRSRDESLDKSKYLLRRYTCVERSSGALVGFGDIGHVPDMFHPDKYWINIWVDPARQGNGIGSEIYERLMGELEDLNAVVAWAGVREDMMSPLEFAQKREFVERMKVWESRLNVLTADTNQFQRYADKVAEDGIRISTLAEERQGDPEALQKLYEVVMAISADIPQISPFTKISYEQWEAFELTKNPSLTPEGYMIAKDGNRTVGLSVVWRSEDDPKALYQGNTGVIREYRGRGIAIAMKLRVIDFARKNGFERLKTWNASNNAAMLAVNMKLGFKKQVGWLTMEKNLA